jgi:predicted CXXCH cytochrome family protein
MFSVFDMMLEWLIVGGCLLITVLALRRELRSPAAWTGVIAGFALALGGTWIWSARLHQRDQDHALLATKIPREERPGGFTGSASCQSCHPDQYASWHRSFHRTMTQRATPETVRGDFDHVTLKEQGQTYRLQRQGDDFVVDMVDPDWSYVQILKQQAHLQGRGPAPELVTDPPRSLKRISLLTGSHHMQAYWTWSDYGNMQFSFPFTYLFEAKRWVPRRDVFLFPPDSYWPLHVWNVGCITCHATAGQPRQDPKTSVIDTRTAELGIACEACHGPAEEHARANSNPARRYSLYTKGAMDPTIFNPARADHVKASEACGQCHAVRHRPPYEKWNADGSDFRPGGDLETCAALVRYDAADLDTPAQEKKRYLMEGSFWPDGMVRVSGRDYNGLAASPCFKRGDLSCLSCHSLHQYVSNDMQLGQGMDGNQACLQCHTTMATKVQEHTHHRNGSSGSLCYNCHMPRTSYGLLKAIRSHEIHSPTVSASLQTGRPNACNLCHLDQSLGWTAKRLNEWYGQAAPVLTPDQQSVSAAVLWLLSGDAGQRALLAWHCGWQPAKEISGHDWMAPHLAPLLEDPYSVVRYIAHRSLRRLPGFEQFDYDFIGSTAERATARNRAMELWRRGTTSPLRERPAVLLGNGGALNEPQAAALLRQRNDRRLELLE